MKLSEENKAEKMQTLQPPEMDEIISEDLINKFIKRQSTGINYKVF